jgi:transmembrane protein
VSAAVPRLIEALLAIPGLDLLARLALASPFLVSGIAKLLDFAGASAELAGFGLRPEGTFAASIIVTQLSGSALFLSRRCCWLAVEPSPFHRTGDPVGASVLEVRCSRPHA